MIRWKGRWLEAVLALAVAMLMADGAAARDVKRCGITIGAGKTGRLLQDVRCGFRCVVDPSVACTGIEDEQTCPIAGSRCAPEVLHLERNATLELNGFRLFGAWEEKAIECSAASSGRCTVRGPGEIKVKDAHVIEGHQQRVVLEDLSIRGPIYGGVGTDGWITARNVRFEACEPGISGLWGDAGVRAIDVDLGSCSIWSQKNLYAQRVRGLGDLEAAGTLYARNVLISGSLSAKDVSIRGTQIGTEPQDPQLETYVTATRRLVARDATLYFIESGVAPRLIRSTCQQSARFDGSGSWGVCAED